MRKKQIDKLIDGAHIYFDKSSIFEVIDTDKGHVRVFNNKRYNNPDPQRIEAYLDVVAKIKNWL